MRLSRPVDRARAAHRKTPPCSLERNRPPRRDRRSPL